MTQASSAIGFGSKVHVLGSRAQWEKLPLRKLRRRRKHVSELGNKWSTKRAAEVYTDKAETCNIAGLTDGRKATLAHVIPAFYNISEFGVVKFIVNFWSGLKKKTAHNYNALITGGGAFKQDDDFLAEGRSVKDSKKLFEKFKAYFEGYKVPTSIVWGQKQSSEIVNGKLKPVYTNVLYSGKENTWFLYSTQDIKNVDDLKKAYSHISICEKDELFINNKHIKRKDHPELFSKIAD